MFSFESSSRPSDKSFSHFSFSFGLKLPSFGRSFPSLILFSFGLKLPSFGQGLPSLFFFVRVKAPSYGRSFPSLIFTGTWQSGLMQLTVNQPVNDHRWFKSISPHQFLHFTVNVAQLVELRIVSPAVGGSSPLVYPKFIVSHQVCDKIVQCKIGYKK